MTFAQHLNGSRIAILVQNLPVPFDRRVWQEARALADVGANVVVICPSDDRHPVGDFEIDGVSVRRYSAPPEASGVWGYLYEYGYSIRRMMKTLRTERKSGRFDVIHFCNPPDLLYRVAVPYGRRDKTVLIFDQHDLGPELVRAKHMPFNFLLVAVASLIERRTYKAADHVIATNESYKAIATQRGSFEPTDVTVVRSGPPRNWADNLQPKDWHRGHKYLIGYLGVMGRQEGIEYLIDAVAILVNEMQLDVGVSLVGSGPDRQRLESLVASVGLTENFLFHGRVSDDDLMSILADADVCANPDEVNDMNELSTMNKIIEYMALSRPIVQFDVKEGRFSAGQSSLYADANSASSFAEKIRDVLQNPDLAARMAIAGRTRFEEVLCWDVQSRHLIDAYQTLINSSAKNHSTSPVPRRDGGRAEPGVREEAMQ